MNISVLGIDIAKNVFQLHGADAKISHVPKLLRTILEDETNALSVKERKLFNELLCHTLSS